MSERLARVAALFGALVACNPQSGFESAADAINPHQKSYVDGPGSRLTAGPYDRVEIERSGDESRLYAWRRDDGGQSLTVFAQGDMTGCRITPNAYTWLASRPSTKPYRLLPYWESRDENGVGILRFSSMDCKIEPYSLQASALSSNDVPIPGDLVFDAGFLVKSGTALVLADPWSASTRVVVNEFQRLISLATFYLVWGDSQIVVFDKAMNELARYGKHVSAIVELGFGSAVAVAVVDDDGLHFVTAHPNSNGQGLNSGFDLTFDVADPLACAMRAEGTAYSGWVMVHSPCGDPHLVAERMADATTPVEQRRFSAQADASAANVVLLPPEYDRVGAFFLEDVDPGTGLGTLFAVQQDGEPVRLGAHAPLTTAWLVGDTTSPWSGSAVVDVQAGLGRLVRWSWAGAVEVIAENVYFSAPTIGLLVNYNGHSGDVPVGNGDGEQIIQMGVPPFDSTVRSDLTEYLNTGIGWELQLGHYDGVTGDLMIRKVDAPSLLPAPFQLAGSRVLPAEYRFLDTIPLPGFAYLGDCDEKALTCTLFVQNTSLGSTLPVAENVSDFTVTNYPLPGILYSVPSGENAGLWFARAK